MSGDSEPKPHVNSAVRIRENKWFTSVETESPRRGSVVKLKRHFSEPAALNLLKQNNVQTQMNDMFELTRAVGSP